MNRYALIKNNIVVNIVVWDGAGDMFADFKAVNISGVAVDIGWIYDGNNFTAPEPEKTKEQLIQEAELEKKGAYVLQMILLTASSGPVKRLLVV